MHSHTSTSEREKERKKRQPIPPRRLYHNTIKSLSQFSVSTFFRSLHLKNERNNNNKCVLQKEQLTHPVEECTNQAKRERIGKSFFFLYGLLLLNSENDIPKFHCTVYWQEQIQLLPWKAVLDTEWIQQKEMPTDMNLCFNMKSRTFQS